MNMAPNAAAQNLEPTAAFCHDPGEGWRVKSCRTQLDLADEPVGHKPCAATSARWAAGDYGAGSTPPPSPPSVPTRRTPSSGPVAATALAIAPIILLLPSGFAGAQRIIHRVAAWRACPRHEGATPMWLTGCAAGQSRLLPPAKVRWCGNLALFVPFRRRRFSSHHYWWKHPALFTLFFWFTPNQERIFATHFSMCHGENDLSGDIL